MNTEKWIELEKKQQQQQPRLINMTKYMDIFSRNKIVHSNTIFFSAF